MQATSPARTQSVCPQSKNPYGLVSPLQMREFLLGRLLYHASFCGYESHYAMESKPGERVLDGDRDNYRKALDEIEYTSETCDLDALPDQIERVRAELKEPQCTYGEVGQLMNDLRLRMHDQLKRRLCLYIQPSRAGYYQNADSLGAQLAGGYDDAFDDAAEAYRCLALGRYTAAVFHSMRVLEVGLSKLAAHFGVDFSHSNWHKIIEAVESRIRDMGKDPTTRAADWQDQQERFSQCACSLMLLKNAWRNYTAHARGKFDDQEAIRVLDWVGSFMSGLYRLLPQPFAPIIEP